MFRDDAESGLVGRNRSCRPPKAEDFINRASSVRLFFVWLIFTLRLRSHIWLPLPLLFNLLSCLYLSAALLKFFIFTLSPSLGSHFRG